MMNTTEVVPAGNGVRCPDATGPMPLTWTVALPNTPQVIVWRTLVLLPWLVDETVTRSRPSPVGVAWVVTRGRGLQAVGVGVGAGEMPVAASNAPMSQTAWPSLLPSRGRGCWRWSSLGQPLLMPPSIAGLPG